MRPSSKVGPDRFRRACQTNRKHKYALSTLFRLGGGGGGAFDATPI